MLLKLEGLNNNATYRDGKYDLQRSVEVTVEGAGRTHFPLVTGPQVSPWKTCQTVADPLTVLGLLAGAAYL